MRPARGLLRPARSDAPPTPAALERGERFAAYVAHELRTPIAVQRALVEVALADPRADTAAFRAMGEDALASCEQQQRLIDALLDLTRSRYGLTRHEPIDIAAITTDVLGAHELSKFESVVTLEPARTTGDPDLLKRLAANLLSNATCHNVTGGQIEVAMHGSPRNPEPLLTASGSVSPSSRQSPTPTTPPSPPNAQAGGGLTIDVSFPANTAAVIPGSATWAIAVRVADGVAAWDEEDH
jgi:signal transduction histidine kinase